MEPYIGEIRMFGGTFAPAGWQFCDGTLYPIAEYETLYALIGTTYGGDGQSMFAVPDLRSRIPIGTGPTAAGQVFVAGVPGGAESVTLTQAQLPAHAHNVKAVSSPGNTGSPLNALPATASSGGTKHYVTAPKTLTKLAPAAVGPNSDTSAPISIVQPVVAVNYIIAMSGVYPSPQ
jgi:microcystin-dependent protein